MNATLRSAPTANPPGVTHGLVQGLIVTLAALAILPVVERMLAAPIWTPRVFAVLLPLLCAVEWLLRRTSPKAAFAKGQLIGGCLSVAGYLIVGALA